MMFNPHLCRTVIVLLSLFSSSLLAAREWKFQFTEGPVQAGFTQVNAAATYDAKIGYGFRPLGIVPNRNTAQIFAIDAEEGNYEITIRFGHATQATSTTIKAESRRLMVEKVATQPGKFEHRTIIVNVRRPAINGGGNTSINDREKGPPTVADWDEQLSFEINGKQPGVAFLEIKPAPDVPTIFLAGDSTVTDQTREPWAGWGQMLPCFFTPRVAISNHAESGLALYSFERQKRLAKVFSMMRKGDYLFIQFGHNDQKDKSAGAGPFTSYKANLKKYVTATREHGGIPVLITPMERRRWKDGQPIPTLTDYAEAVRQVASEEKVPCIDLNAMSLRLYTALGTEKSKLAFVHFPANTFPGQTEALSDDTHHSNYGGYELARCVVEGIKAVLPDLAKHLGPDTVPFDPSKPDAPEQVSIPATPAAGAIQKPAGS